MNRLLPLISLLGLSLIAHNSLALPSDNTKPITITSGEAQYNQHGSTLVYQGNVVAIQGTTQLMADRVVVHFNPENKIDNLEAFGQPAVFSTLTSEQRGKLVAKANSIEFHPLVSRVQLKENGSVSQDGNSMKAPHIVIDIANESIVSKPSPLGKTTIVLEPQQRVKLNDKSSRSQQPNRHKA